MWPDVIVLAEPLVDDDLGLFGRADALQNRSTSYGGISRVQFPACLPFPEYP